MAEIVVYIASPYTLGDQEANVMRQIDAANELLDLGITPVCPLLSHYIHMKHPRPYDDWLKMDLALINRSDCLLRLDGFSYGADEEVIFASKHGKPIFNDIKQIIQYYGL